MSLQTVVDEKRSRPSWRERNAKTVRPSKRRQRRRGNIVYLDQPDSLKNGQKVDPATELAEARKFGVSPEMLEAAKRIDAEIKSGRLSYKALSRRSGLSEHAIKQWLKTFRGEDGTRNPQLASLKFVLRALGGKMQVVWE